MAKKKATQNKSNLTDEQISQKKERLENLRKKNQEKMMIETNSGGLIPDFKLKAFEKQYKPELSKVAQDFRQINGVIYDNVPDGENPIIPEARDYLIEEYLGFTPLDKEADGREKSNYYKAVKAFFKALRDGEIEELVAELE